MQGSPCQPKAAAETPPVEEGPPPGKSSPSTEWLGGASAALASRLKRLAAATANHVERARVSTTGPKPPAPPEGDGKARLVLTGTRTSKLVGPDTKPQ